MMMPSIFNEFDRFFDFPFTAQSNGLMRTDIKDTDAGYEISIELPGMKKENVNAKLDNGYLTISASGSQKKDEKDSDGNYIHRALQRWLQQELLCGRCCKAGRHPCEIRRRDPYGYRSESGPEAD